MDLNSQFPGGEDEQVFAELCREPESAIPLLQSVNLILCFISLLTLSITVRCGICLVHGREKEGQEHTIDS